MTDTSMLVTLADRVNVNIDLGESHVREFKSAFAGPPGAKRPRAIDGICRDVAEALVAFTNADGGDLLVGVEDDGSITGLPHSQEDRDRLLLGYRALILNEQELPLIYATTLAIKDKIVGFFSVSKSSTRIFQLTDGRCVRRKDRATEPVLAETLVFERQEVKSRENEREFVDGAQVSDLDVDEINSLSGIIFKGLSPERYLQQMGLAEYVPGGLRLRRAALLLFARDITRWHPRCQVRILRVHGTRIEVGDRYNVSQDVVVTGNVLQLIGRAWEQLRLFLVVKTSFGSDSRFQQQLAYPEQACYEAIVNAIAHRDYSLHTAVEVMVFDDRMEIKSPGALLSSIRVSELEKLIGAHESRNALIARTLREHRIMRELGEGMRRIFTEMERNDLERPALYSNTVSFSVTLRSKSIFSPEQERWLASFEAFDLSRLQKRIVVAGMGGAELSPEDIYRAMNTRDRDAYDREVTALRTKGVLREIRNQSSATQFARANNVDKKKVKRFTVGVPSMHASPAMPQPPPIRQATYLWLGGIPDKVADHDVEALVKKLSGFMNINVKPGIVGQKQAFVNFALGSDLEAAARAISATEGLGAQLKIEIRARRN